MSENMTQLLAKLAAVTERAEKAEEEVEAMKLENGFVHMHKIDDAESWKDRAESAEEELLAVREDNHSMMLEIDGLRTERDALASELAKLRAQEPVAYLDYWKSDGTGIVRKQRTTGVPFFNSPVPAPAVPAPTPFLPDADTRRNDEAFAAQQAATALSVPDGDDFNGTTPHLIQCMEALVRLDADGVLVPHGIGRSASRLLSAAANRLRKQTAPSVPEEWRAAMQEAHDTFQRYADLHRAKDTRDGHEKARPYQKLANKLYALLQSVEGRSSQTHNEVRHD